MYHRKHPLTSLHFKFGEMMKDGHKLAEDLQGLQLGVQRTDRQTDRQKDRQLCATDQAPNVQTAFGIYGPS
jgi:1-acyl-sn-glycerol-3-phosphate acyltransferase